MGTWPMKLFFTEYKASEIIVASTYCFTSAKSYKKVEKKTPPIPFQCCVKTGRVASGILLVIWVHSRLTKNCPGAP